MSIVESDGPPSWSLDVSETGESTKNPVSRGDGVPSFARIKRPRWRPVGLNDRHLRSHEKIGDCEQSNDYQIVLFLNIHRYYYIYNQINNE